MDEHSIMNFIKLYRHDLMNHLQLLTSYFSLGNSINAENKMNEIIHYYNEERKLFSLNAPKLALYLLFFNHNYANKNLTYRIGVDNIDLSAECHILYCESRLLVEYFKYKNVSVMYNWKLCINYCEENHAVKFSYSISNEQIDQLYIENIKENNHFSYPVHVIKKQKSIIVYFFVPSK